jgi:hypothetical protein
MKQNNVRGNIALTSLASLTDAQIPYAVQRNFDEIHAGSYKDIDLIAPHRSVNPIRRIFDLRDDVIVTYLKRSLSRSQIVAFVSTATPQRILIDIDHQITLVGDPSLGKQVSRLLSRSIVFSDLKTRQSKFGDMKITLLDPASELLLLKIHAHKKPKLSYLARINELETNGLTEYDILPSLRPLWANLLRRYGLLVYALPGWIATRLRLSRIARFCSPFCSR